MAHPITRNCFLSTNKSNFLKIQCKQDSIKTQLKKQCAKQLSDRIKKSEVADFIYASHRNHLIKCANRELSQKIRGEIVKKDKSRHYKIEFYSGKIVDFIEGFRGGADLTVELGWLGFGLGWRVDWSAAS